MRRAQRLARVVRKVLQQIVRDVHGPLGGVRRVQLLPEAHAAQEGETARARLLLDELLQINRSKGEAGDGDSRKTRGGGGGRPLPGVRFVGFFVGAPPPC